MSKNDTDSSLRYYLTRLNDTPLLTRDEENELLKNLEIRQMNILHNCVKSDFFKSELYELLKSMSTENIEKISRKLDDESDPEDQEKITTDFIELVEALEENQDQDAIEELLGGVALSGTIINKLVTNLKKKYAKVQEAELILNALTRFFEVKTYEQVSHIILKLKEKEAAKDYFSRKYRTDATKLMMKVHDFDTYKNQMSALESVGVTVDNLQEIKDLYSTITKTEFEMKRYRDELIRRNLRLVVSRAKRHLNRGLDFEDLVQEGNIGLIKAINKHDTSRGTKVSTHATWWIDQAIKRAISNKSKTVRIPTHIEWLQTNLAKAVKKLTADLKRAPTKEELAKEVEVDVSVLTRLEKVALHKIGIEDELSSGKSLLEMLPADAADSPFNVTSKKMLRERIRQILGTLSPRTEKIIRLRFGIGEPKESMTLQQIANQVGLTKMGVKLIQNKGIKKIKKGVPSDS